MFERFTLLPDEELKRYESEYNNIRISIKGLYGWGDGYYTNKPFDTVDVFRTIEESLKRAGFDVSGRTSSSCNRLTQFGTNLDLYLHPMEFTGSATPEQTEKVLKVLEPYSDYIRFSLESKERLYDIPDRTYQFMIYDRAEEIAEELLRDISDFDSDMAFARNCRIERVQHYTVGYSSSDVDVACVSHIRNRVKELLKEGKDRDDIPKIIGKQAKLWCRELDDCKARLNTAVKSMLDGDGSSFDTFQKCIHTNYSDAKVFRKRINEFGYEETMRYMPVLDTQRYRVYLTCEAKINTYSDILKTNPDANENDFKRDALRHISQNGYPYGQYEVTEIKDISVEEDEYLDKNSRAVTLTVNAKLCDKEVFSKSLLNVLNDTVYITDKGVLTDIKVTDSKIKKVGLPLRKEIENYRKPYYLQIEPQEDGTYIVEGIMGITPDMRNAHDLVCRITDKNELVVADEGMVVVKNPIHNMSLAEIEWSVKEQAEVDKVLSNKTHQIQKGQD